MAFSSCDLNEAVCDALQRAGLIAFTEEHDEEGAANVLIANAVQKALDDRAELLDGAKVIRDKLATGKLSAITWGDLQTLCAAIANAEKTTT